MNLGSKADDSSLDLVYLIQQMFSCYKNAYLVFGSYLLYCSQELFAIRRSRPWLRKRHFEAIWYPLPANEGIFDAQYHQWQIHKAVPGPQVILVAGILTS